MATEARRTEVKLYEEGGWTIFADTENFEVYAISTDNGEIYGLERQYERRVCVAHDEEARALMEGDDGEDLKYFDDSVGQGGSTCELRERGLHAYRTEYEWTALDFNDLSTPEVDTLIHEGVITREGAWSALLADMIGAGEVRVRDAVHGLPGASDLGAITV